MRVSAPTTLSDFGATYLRPVRSLPTLRRHGCPCTTQDSLAARWLGFDRMGFAPIRLACPVSEVTHLLPWAQALPGAPFARLFPGDPAFATTLLARRSQRPATAFTRAAYRRCSDSVMLRPGHSLALLGSPVLRRRGLYPRSFHRGGHPASMSDLLRGCQAIAAADPSSAGLRWLQAARSRSLS